MPTCEYETRLICSAEKLFDFLSRPDNITRVTSPQLGISFTSTPNVFHQGAQVEFQVVTFGQVVKSSHQIVEFDRPRLIVEEQITGPMKSWLHRHEYEMTAGGVLMRDVVDFELPGGLIGLLLSASKVCDYLEDGFFFREQRLRELIDHGELE